MIDEKEGGAKKRGALNIIQNSLKTGGDGGLGKTTKGMVGETEKQDKGGRRGP